MSHRIELRIESRDPFAEGHEFENAGAYERLDGRVRIAIDPDAPPYSGVVDVSKAPLDGEGYVELTADVCILKPVNASLGNARLLFGYGNRGNKRELQFFNDAPATNNPHTLRDAGNGFLMRRGYTMVWGAWEGDLLPGDERMLLDVPVASDRGTAITGLVRSEFIADAPGVRTLALSGRASTRSYPTVSLDTTRAQLTRRRYAEDEREPMGADQWSFARIESGQGLDGQGSQSAIVPSDRHIYLPNGFEPGWIYELVYTGRDPLVLGLGHVAVRDLVSFLRYDRVDTIGNPNPLAAGNGIEKAYAWGRSQTGRCIRDFVYLGFNADEHGRRVFDGVMPHVSGAGRMWLNHRFANAVSAAGQQYEAHFTCADRFPFAYAECTDHLTGRRDGILKRPATDPLVIHTQSATEYWQRRGSLVHTDTEGRDLEQPETVRVYLWSSSQHFADPNLRRPVTGVCQQLGNVVRTSMLFRAMLDALDRWATDGTPPPPSRIPSRDDATLVTHTQWRSQFPAIAGVAVPREPNGFPFMDFGSDFDRGLLTVEPPRVSASERYCVLVPAVDEDGNDRAGVRAPMVSAPLGTYTGWNLRRRGVGHGAMFEFSGSYIPFAETPEERRAIGDPRPSILERYADAGAYSAAIEKAARSLVDAGLMLEEDVAREVQAAADWGRPRHDVLLP